MADDSIPNLNHDVAVATLHSIITEARHNSTSGDTRLAGEARRDFLFAAIMLKTISAVGADDFNAAEYPDLPTPEALEAANITPDNPATSIAPDAVQTSSSAPANNPPQNADDLANQGGGGVVTAPSDVTNETVTGEDSGTEAAETVPSNAVATTNPPSDNNGGPIDNSSNADTPSN